MNYINVESSNIEKIAYENNNLYVGYKGGGVYKYLDVSSEKYNEFLNAESKGRYLNSAIKESYKYEKVK